MSFNLDAIDVDEMQRVCNNIEWRLSILDDFIDRFDGHNLEKFIEDYCPMDVWKKVRARTDPKEIMTYVIQHGWTPTYMCTAKDEDPRHASVQEPYKLNWVTRDSNKYYIEPFVIKSAKEGVDVPIDRLKEHPQLGRFFREKRSYDMYEIHKRHWINPMNVWYTLANYIEDYCKLENVPKGERYALLELFQLRLQPFPPIPHLYPDIQYVSPDYDLLLIYVENASYFIQKLKEMGKDDHFQPEGGRQIPPPRAYEHSGSGPYSLFLHLLPYSEQLRIEEMHQQECQTMNRASEIERRRGGDAPASAASAFFGAST